MRIPSFYAGHCSDVGSDVGSDVALDRGFCAVRHGEVRRAKVLRGSCAVRGAEVVRNLKSLAGEWEGPVTVPEMPEMSGGKPMHVSLRVTSRGNALVHEIRKQERRWMRPSTTIR